MPAEETARRRAPKNHTLSFMTGPPSATSNCLTYAVVGVPPVPGLQPGAAEQLSTLLPLKSKG